MFERWVRTSCLVALGLVGASAAARGADVQLLEVVQAAARDAEPARGSAPQLLGDFYRAYMDEARIDAQGLAPLRDELGRIDALRTAADVARYLGAVQRSGVPSALAIKVAPDPSLATRYAATLEQGGLTLPGREYYLSPDAHYSAVRARFLTYLEQLLARGGHAEAASAAMRIEALETRLANYHENAAASPAWPRPFADFATQGRLGLSQLQTLSAGMDWPQFFAGAALPATEVYVAQPTFVFGLGLLVRTVPVADWRAYFKFRLLDHYAPHLPEPLARLHAEFHSQWPGAAAPLPRSLRALREIERSLGPVLSDAYADRQLSDSARANAQRLVDDVLLACETSVQQATWLSDATRARLRARLANLALQVGAPRVGRDYVGLVVSATDLIGNLRRTAEFQHTQRVRRIDAPVDPATWEVPAYSVNVLYRPQLHELIVPAGALDTTTLADPAATAQNYAGNGVRIARAIYVALSAGDATLAPLESNLVATVELAGTAAQSLALENRTKTPN